MSETPKHAKWALRSISAPLKGGATFLMILALVSILLGGAVLFTTDSMVIYAQKNKLDFIQVFFPIDGTYSEANSERTALFVSSPDGVEISLPREQVDFVRIDPANEVAEIIITKIELRRLGGTETLMPGDLLTAVKPIQMIDKVTVVPAGLLIRSTGNDPAFEMRLGSPSRLSQLFKLAIISIFLSLAVFFGLGRLVGKHRGAARERAYLLVIPFLFSIGIAALFYPGFMSYDTLHALRSARNGVTDSMWPPMVSYVWRAVDLVSLNPAAMHFSQVFLLLLSIFFIIFLFTKRLSYAAVFLLAYLSMPVILGTVAVIWKDVLMAAFFVAGFAVIVSMRLITNKWRFASLAMFAVFLIFLGVCSRHNAIIGAVPLLFYLAFVVCSRVFNKPFRIWISVMLSGMMLTGTIFSAKSILDNYALPGFEKLSTSNEFFIRSVRILDVAGASLCLEKNLFADVVSDLSLAEIESKFDPRHINLSRSLLERVGTDSRIDKIWQDVALHHPICFFNYKFQLTKYMVGANEGPQFLITHPLIDNNEYGYDLPKSPLRNGAVAYITHTSQLAFFKPWFLYLISIGVFIYMVRARALTAGHLTIFSSAIFYFAGLVMFGNAADARLLFYTTSALSIFTFISIFKIKKEV